MKKAIVALIVALLAAYCASGALAAPFELDGLTWAVTTDSAEAWLGDGVRRSEADGVLIMEKDGAECLGCSGVSTCLIFSNDHASCFYFLFPNNSVESKEALSQALAERFGAPDGEDALPYSLFDMVSLAGGVDQTRLCAWTTDDGISVDLYEIAGSEGGDDPFRYIVSFTSDIDLMNGLG